jgi:OOP family OmpA-OmpF porin
MKLRLLSLAVALMSSVIASAAIASEQEGQWYVSGLATYIDPADNRRLKDEFAGAQFGFGRAFSEHWNAELEIDFLDVSGDNGARDVDFTGVALNGMFVLNRAGAISPYLLGGIGALNFDPDNNAGDDTDLQLQIGPGVLIDLGTERLALRAEVLARWSDSDPHDATDMLVNVGLQFAFGGEKGKAVIVPPPPLDSDGDGVTDDLDQCPNTPQGVSVDEVGCPLDSDGDGVPDYLDQCPNTPQGATVDDVGCPMDTDGDGVFDGIDQCPDTIKGALVDSVGCGYKLTGAQFGFDSAEITANGGELLDEVADRMVNDYPDISVTVEGYTDSRGDENYNQGLSLRRAESAKQELVSKGVPEDRITTVGMGESNPVASNDTDAGRAENRRVVLMVD